MDIFLPFLARFKEGVRKQSDDHLLDFIELAFVAVVHNV
jgi:hypothetical protein